MPRLQTLPRAKFFQTTPATFQQFVPNSVHSAVVPPELELEGAGDDERRATQEAAGDHPLEGPPQEPHLP